jgi:uncharacterized protein YecE (DUF72 family)
VERPVEDDAVAAPPEPEQAASRALDETREPPILVGTSGYVFPDWVGRFYPPGTKTEQMLPIYARFFPTVEINMSFYRMPEARLFERMSERTPPSFQFMIKAYRGMTHDPSEWLDGAICAPFLESLAPLEQQGKLAGVLAQFPWSFRNTEENRHHLADLREKLAGLPLFVEFRRDEWLKEPVLDLLRRLDLGWCSVDEPHLPGLLPPEHHATNGTGYVRLHGRNSQTWWRGNAKDRYDYSYTKDELGEWVRKIRSLLGTTNRTFVFFNNCYAGQAADNARVMQELLFGGE